MSAGPVRFRLLTPRGVGGIAVVEVAGRGRLDAVARLLRRRSSAGVVVAADLDGIGPTLLQLHLDRADVDEVLFVDRPGRDVAELHLHGSDAVLDALDAAVGGLEPARPSSRAARLLSDAISVSQLALAIEQLASESWPAFVRRMRRAPRPERDAARGRSRVASALANPARAVLVGRQNAGKSTLLNRLVFADRALAGPLAGLTRDPVRDVVSLGGYPYELIDTAGAGPAFDPVDRHAQELGLREHRGAIRLVVCDGSMPITGFELGLLGPASLVVRTKSDLTPDASWPPLDARVVEVSCLHPASATSVRGALGDALRDLRGLPPAPPDGVGGPAAFDDP